MTTLGAARLPFILQALGAGTSTIGAFSEALTQKSLLHSQADISEVNARLADSRARSALDAGVREQQASRLRTSQVKGASRAAMAANGIDLGVGSAAETLTTTDIVGEWDANTIASNALRSAWGYRMEAVDARGDAAMRRAGARAISPGMAAATTLLGRAGTVADSWYEYKRKQRDEADPRWVVRGQRGY